MIKMKKAIAASVLSVALLVPSIAEAKDMMPMEPKSGTMMEQVKTMNQSEMMDQSKMMEMNDLVPLRMFAETLGYTIMWNKADRSITLTYMGMDMGMDMNKDMSMNSDMSMDSDMDMNKGMDMNNDMSNQSGPMMMSDMYMIKLMLNSKSIMVGKDTKMLTQAPMLMDGKVYISKEVVKMYLLAPFMMKSM